MIQQVAVLAGGLATRMYPITKTIPKSMIEVMGEPFLSHQLRQFKENGMEEVVMCVGHFADQIIDYFGSGASYGISIVYSIEQERLGTGGALKYGLKYLDDTFFVIYGDSFLEQPYKPVVDFFEAHDAKGLMTVVHNNNEIEPSRILVDGQYIQQYKKDPPPPGAEYGEYGLNIFKKEIIDQVEGTTYPISDYFDLLTPQKQLLAFEVKDRYYEIGSPTGLEELKGLLTRQ